MIPDAVPAAAEPVQDDAEAPEEQKIALPEHGIEWIDFGMMGALSSKQRQLLIDMVTNVVMQDAYGLKRTVLQIAQPKGEIDPGALLEMCESMCGQYTGVDFGFEEKALGTVSRLTGYAVRALVIVAFIIGSCLLCAASAFTGEGTTITIIFRILGFLGLGVSVFFSWRLYRNMKKNK